MFESFFIEQALVKIKNKKFTVCLSLPHRLRCLGRILISQGLLVRRLAEFDKVAEFVSFS